MKGAELLALWDEYRGAGKSQRDLASYLGLSVNVVKTRIYYARNKKRGSSKKPLEMQPGTDQVSVNDGHNDRELSYSARGVSPRIKTLDALLTECRVDLNKWAVERWVANKWEVGVKQKDGSVCVEPLFQVKAWLLRKEPIAITPILDPVRIGVSLPAVAPATKLAKIKTALQLFDGHFGFKRDPITGRLIPFHDRAALDVALQIARDIDLDEIDLGGDFLDLPEWSDRFIRSPDFVMTTQPAVIELVWWLAQFRAVTPGKVKLIEGNHDLRLLTAIMTHLMAAWQLRPAHELDLDQTMSVPRLLGLDRLGIDWIGDYPRGKSWLNPVLCCKHGNIARGKPGATAAAVVDNATVSIGFGHIHRRELATRNLPDENRDITAYCPGCLCRIDGVVPGHNPDSQNWQQGFSIVNYDDTQVIGIDLIPIRDGVAWYRGRKYTARDRLGALRAETDPLGRWGF